jgi:hypothetical protein
LVFLNIFDDPLKKILKRAKKYVILIRLLFQLKSKIFKKTNEKYPRTLLNYCNMNKKIVFSKTANWFEPKTVHVSELDERCILRDEILS